MKKISIVIPVFNIKNRGYHRLELSLLSLSRQKEPVKVVVSDGSFDPHEIKRITEKYNFKYIHTNLKEFNKPVLLNRGIEVSDTEYVMCSDVDYAFRDDFSQSILNNDKKDRMIVKQVLMSPEVRPNKNNVINWSWNGAYPNKYGKMADGACQFAHTSWWEKCGGYDERMSGWSAMDNQMTKRAKLGGMEVYWMEDSEIIHIWHKVEKFRKARDISLMKRNFQILNATTSYKVGK